MQLTKKTLTSLIAGALLAALPGVTSASDNGLVVGTLTSGITQPSGLAYDRQGNLIIADSAGQRIREYRNGRVETVAGSGDVDPATRTVTGGYVDGDTQKARFNFPVGVAVSRDGAIYVADSQNHVIRRISGGRVTTFAGTVEDDAGHDGPRGVGSFHDPLGISFGPDGTLYVADYGVGLRAVSKDGGVRTMYAVPDTTGVSVAPNTSSLTIWWCGLTELRRSVPDAKDEQRFPNTIQQGQGVIKFHTPFQVYAVSEKDALFSDLTSNTVRYYRLANEFERTPLIRALVGPDTADEMNTGGFQDGPSGSAGANAPAGVAMENDGTIVFSDGGSGRIRTIKGFSTRHYIDPDLQGLEPLQGNPIRIALVGNSYASWDVLWSESIGGTLESRLNDFAVKTHFGRRFHVDVLRSAGTTIPQELQQVTSMLFDSDFKGVILMVNPYNDGSLRTETTFGSIPAQEMQASIENARDQLRQHNMFFLSVVHPVAAEVAPSERMVVRIEDNTACVDRGNVNAEMNFLQSLKVPSLDATPAFIAAENSVRHAPLFGADDHHFSVVGNRVLGDFIADTLESLQPWATDQKAVQARIASYTTQWHKSARPTPASDCTGHPINRDFPGARALPNGSWENVDGTQSNASYSFVNGQPLSVSVQIAKSAVNALSSVAIITSDKTGYYLQSYPTGTSLATSKLNIGSILGTAHDALPAGTGFHSYRLTITPGSPNRIEGTIDGMNFSATDSGVSLHGTFHVVIRTGGPHGQIKDYTVSPRP